MSNHFGEIEADLDRIAVNRADVEALLARMAQDLRTAERLRDDDPAWSLTITHQAIYNGCVALMAAHGHRPRINGHHRTALQFARLALPEHGALLRQANLLPASDTALCMGGPTVSRADVEAGLVLARRLAPIFRDAALTEAAGGA